MNAPSSTHEPDRTQGHDRRGEVLAWLTAAHLLLATLVSLCQLLRWLP